MKAEDLKNSILQMAMEGKLVPQDSDDEPASVLLDKIKEEKEKLIKEKKIKRNNKESFIFRKDNHFYEKVGKKGEAVCIDDEIPWDIPDSWEWVRLNHISQLNGGFAFKSSEFKKEGIRIIRISDFDEEGFKNDKIVYYEENSELDKYCLENKDILMAMTGGTVGKTYLVNNLNEKMYVNQRVATIRIIKTVNIDYIYSILESNYIKNIIHQNKNSTNDNISMKTINSFLIPLPPSNEQKNIVKKLYDITPFIEKYDILESCLEELNMNFPMKIKNSILQDAVQGKLVSQDPDDEPAIVLLEKIREEKERLIKEKKIKRNKNESFIFKENNHFYEKIGNKEPVCIDDEIPFEIPESWKWCRLGDLVYNFGQKKPDKTFSYIDVSSIDNKNLKLSNQETILTKDEAPSRARKIIKKDAIIYSTVRPYLLNMCIIDKEFSHEPIASTAFAILNPFNGIYNKYLFYFLQSPTFINYVNNVMSGVAYPAINDKKIYNSLIALPPQNEQIRIVEMIEKLTKIIFKN